MGLTSAGGSQRVMVNGRDRHVAGYLRDFLFPPERLQSPVSTLSGGERNRLHLAKLLQSGGNVLLLDEPTNDLDIPTLEVLEESLLDLPGALVLVTHDRYLMDRVADLILGLDGRGGTRQVADLDQWARQVDKVPGDRKVAGETDKPKEPRPRRSASASPPSWATWSSASWTAWSRPSRRPKR